MPMIKRLKKEFKLLKELSKSDDKIYVHPIDIASSAPNEYLAMIVGPSDTPYEGGFFYFHLILPDSFPMEPPKIKYLTQGNKVRFNPNLYVNGKVCLSVIGTWAGPGWSPANTIVSVLQIIQGLVLNETPLINEPGFETAPKYKLNNYNEIIRFETYRTALLGQINFVPFTSNQIVDNYFTGVARQCFLTDINTYYAKMIKLSQLHDGKTYSIAYQNQTVKPNYSSLINILIKQKEIMETTYPTMDFSHVDFSHDTFSPQSTPFMKGVPVLLPGIQPNLYVLKKKKLAMLQHNALQLGIQIKKQGVKGPINKTKAELISEILDF